MLEEKNENFKQYKISTFTKLQRMLLLCGLVLSLVSLAVELGMYITLVLIDQPVAYQITYVLFKIVTPNIFKFTSLFVALKIFKSKKVTLKKKSLAVSLSLFIIASVIGIVHNYFSVLLSAPAFVFFVSSIFGSRRIIKTLGILSIPVFILESITFLLDPEIGPMVFRYLTLVCIFCLMVVSYIYANTLVKTTANQLKYIYKTYHTQAQLIEELKIEPLTKLYNRIAFENTITRILRRYEEEEIHPFMVVMDIDFFKKVNDKYGHTAGDEVLIRLANIVKSNMGSPRQAYRYGGEEFVMLFDTSTEERVLEMVEKIRTDFASAEYLFAPELRVTLSAGIADYKKPLTGKEWFDNADRALYEAKENGRNRIVISQA